MTICTYMIAIGIGLGTVTWTISTEICPVHLRGAALCVFSVVMSLSKCGLTQIFLEIT